MLKVTNKYNVVPIGESTIDIVVEYPGSNYIQDPVINDSFITLQSKSGTTKVTYTFKVTSLLYNRKRSGYITFGYNEPDNEQFETVSISQVTIVSPIWESYTVRVQDSNFEYRISDNKGHLIFSGSCIDPPDSKGAEIEVTNLIAPLLKINFIDSLDTEKWIDLDGLIYIVVANNNLGLGFVEDVICFKYDYSYKENPSLGFPQQLNNFVENKFVVGAPLPLSIFYPSETGEDFTYIPYPFPNTVDYPTYPIGKIVTYFKTETDESKEKIEIQYGGDTLYVFDKTCSDYLLYYLNREGAIDFLTVSGNTYTYNAHSKTTSKYSAKNRIAQVPIIDDITRSYSLTTGFFTNEQSEIISENLFSSPCIWIYKVSSKESIPVRIDNTKVENKIFKNGKTLITYNIEVIETKNIVVR